MIAWAAGMVKLWSKDSNIIIDYSLASRSYTSAPMVQYSSSSSSTYHHACTAVWYQ